MASQQQLRVWTKQVGGVMEMGGVNELGGVKDMGGVNEMGRVNEMDEGNETGAVKETGGVQEKSGAIKKSETVEESEETVQKMAAVSDEFVHVCEVCGTRFETRRGLSSHARSHLRQLGVCVSESSGAPISLLYELIAERDGALPFTPKRAQVSKSKNSSKHSQHKSKHNSKHGSGTKLKIKLAEFVKRQRVSAPASLRNSSSSSSSSSPLHHHTLLKPPRTPPALENTQETDTPLDLMEMSGISQQDCVHVCELCGAWYETKKGLASHARIHLHQYGVELDPKASPVRLLHELLQKKAGGQDMPTALLTPPPLEKAKLSPAKKRTQSNTDSLKTVSCEFCGENFKKTQSLASHARSHLRQLGVTDWSAHGSPMATLREMMTRRACSSLPQSTPTTPLTPPQVKPPSEVPASPCTMPVRVPRAKKGGRMAVFKPKDEQVELNISTGRPTEPAPQVNFPADRLAADYTLDPSSQKPQVELGVPKPVKCDYCDDLFDSRKALSCHARAHLRQLGVKWAAFASPIDTLHELMIREGRGQDSAGTPSPVGICKEKTETDGAGSACEATCELCGFDFENKKALASHARAHLRQQGEQWGASQSPIAALSQWMSREPEKVAALHRLYMQGTLPQIRKRRACSPIRSSDHADSARSGVSRPSPAAPQGNTGTSLTCSSFLKRNLSSDCPAPHSAVNHDSVGQTSKLFPPKMEGAESVKRVGNAPSLVPRPPETSLVKLVGKIYSLKCRFCEQVFSGPLSVQEDWLIHLRHHILDLNPDHARSPAPIPPHSESAHQIGQAV